METVLLALVALVALAAVALPLVREPAATDRLDLVDDATRERQRLLEERDAALAALRELEFDHRTGKIADADYAELVGDSRRRVADALVALDAPTAAAVPAPPSPSPAVSEDVPA